MTAGGRSPQQEDGLLRAVLLQWVASGRLKLAMWLKDFVNLSCLWRTCINLLRGYLEGKGWKSVWPEVVLWSHPLGERAWGGRTGRGEEALRPVSVKTSLGQPHSSALRRHGHLQRHGFSWAARRRAPALGPAAAPLLLWARSAGRLSLSSPGGRGCSRSSWCGTCWL